MAFYNQLNQCFWVFVLESVVIVDTSSICFSSKRVLLYVFVLPYPTLNNLTWHYIMLRFIILVSHLLFDYHLKEVYFLFCFCFSLHYNTIHYVTLHYIASHDIMSHYPTLHAYNITSGTWLMCSAPVDLKLYFSNSVFSCNFVRNKHNYELQRTAYFINQLAS